MFRVRASSKEDSADYVKVTTDAGHYGSSAVTNVLDGNKQTYWESNKQLSDNYRVATVSMAFIGHMMEDVSRIAILGRQDRNKGIPMKFDILITENETTDTTLIYSSDYSTFTYDGWMQVDIPKSTFGYMKFQISGVQGGEGRTNIAEIAFYKEDKVDAMSDHLFSDGT